MLLLLLSSLALSSTSEAVTSSEGPTPANNATQQGLGGHMAEHKANDERGLSLATSHGAAHKRDGTCSAKKGTTLGIYM
jgi:hypothetical protein